MDSEANIRAEKVVPVGIPVAHGFPEGVIWILVDHQLSLCCFYAQSVCIAVCLRVRVARKR